MIPNLISITNILSFNSIILFSEWPCLLYQTQRRSHSGRLLNPLRPIRSHSKQKTSQHLLLVGLVRLARNWWNNWLRLKCFGEWCWLVVETWNTRIQTWWIWWDIPCKRAVMYQNRARFDPMPCRNVPEPGMFEPDRIPAHFRHITTCMENCRGRYKESFCVPAPNPDQSLHPRSMMLVTIFAKKIWYFFTGGTNSWNQVKWVIFSSINPRNFGRG